MEKLTSAFKPVILTILILVAIVGFMPTRGHVDKLAIAPSKPKPILVLAQIKPVEVAKVEVIVPVAPVVAPAPIKDPVKVAQTAPRPSVTGSCNDWIDQSNISDKVTAKQLIGKESGCNPLAVNPSSGACGLPQSLPCSKLGPVNADGTSAVDPVTQLNWMQNYVISRYGSWASAMTFWHCIGKCSSKNGTINKTATWY